MRRIGLLTIMALAACQSAPRDIPEGTIDVKVHPEFEDIRPVSVAILPVEAPRHAQRMSLRREFYDRLFSKRYSALKLQAVDSHMAANGTFDPGSLEYDATFKIQLSKWKPIPGTTRYSADARVTLTYKTGETLWECEIENYPFKAQDFDHAKDQLAKVFLARLPICPPPTS